MMFKSYDSMFVKILFHECQHGNAWIGTHRKHLGAPPLPGDFPPESASSRNPIMIDVTVKSQKITPPPLNPLPPWEGINFLRGRHD